MAEWQPRAAACWSWHYQHGGFCPEPRSLWLIFMTLRVARPCMVLQEHISHPHVLAVIDDCVHAFMCSAWCPLPRAGRQTFLIAGPLVLMRSRCTENGGTCWQTGRRVDGGQCEQRLRIGPCKKIGSCKTNLRFTCFGTVSSSCSCPEHSFPYIAAGSAAWVLFADAAVFS